MYRFFHNLTSITKLLGTVETMCLPFMFHSLQNHSHKKRKDSLETREELAVFSLSLEIQKFIEPSPREPE